MASSGVTTFTLTVQELIDLSLIDIGALPVGETPTAAEISDAIKRLNILMRSLENDGVHLWKVDTQTISASASDYTYDLAAGTNKVLHAFISANSVDTALNLLTQEEYDSITNKATTGVPTDVCVLYSSDPPSVLLYPVPDGAYTITYRRTKQFDSVTSASETFDVSDNALPMLQKGLAYFLANSYQLPMDERMLLNQEFQVEKIKYLAHNTERRHTEITVPRGLVMV